MLSRIKWNRDSVVKQKNSVENADGVGVIVGMEDSNNGDFEQGSVEVGKERTDSYGVEEKKDEFCLQNKEDCMLVESKELVVINKVDVDIYGDGVVSEEVRVYILNWVQD